MRNFIKIVFGSCLGVFLALIVIGFILSIYTASMITSGKGQPTVKANSVLKLDLNRIMPEKTNNTPEATYNFSEETFVGLQDVLESIRHAKDDRNVKGIYLSLSGSEMGNAKAQSIRNAILNFKESGKFVYAYSGNYGYSQSAYYLATAADDVYLHPLGVVDLRGFSAQILFFKDMLDKMGVKMSVFYAGKYKGATEPFRLNQLSDENRLQIREYINDLYRSFTQDIAASRNLTPEVVDLAAENLYGRSAELALEHRLIDEIKYEDQVFDKIRTSLDLEEDENINFISIQNYESAREKDRNLSAPDKIAVLYAEGEIRAGEEVYGMITDEHFVKMLRKIRNDKKVKSLVLRVNSPGGDSYVSDEIWREIELMQEKGIPVVASMGDVAASGGYYIACGADQIIAEPNTITGSIGVFGIAPNLEELMNDKLGIHLDTVRTAKYAPGVINSFYPVGAEEFAIIQEGIDRTYEAFLSRVAEGRKMSRDQVHEIAQGRVWTGRKALELGLVDQLGNLDDAITLAATLGNTEDYRITEYPRIKDPIQKLLEDLTKQKFPAKIKETIIEKKYPKASQIISDLEYLISSKRPMARLPFAISHN